MAFQRSAGRDAGIRRTFEGTQKCVRDVTTGFTVTPKSSTLSLGAGTPVQEGIEDFCSLVACGEALYSGVRDSGTVTQRSWCQKELGSQVVGNTAWCERRWEMPGIGLVRRQEAGWLGKVSLLRSLPQPGWRERKLGRTRGAARLRPPSPTRVGHFPHRPWMTAYRSLQLRQGADKGEPLGSSPGARMLHPKALALFSGAEFLGCPDHLVLLLWLG